MFNMIPFDQTQSKMGHMFDSFFDDAFNSMLRPFDGCRTDIIDKGKQYVLQAELPGFDKKDIHIHVDGDRLTIQAERNNVAEEKKADGSFIRRERSYGSFSRSFDVSGIEAGQISASYTNGILELVMPKKKDSHTGGRKIDIA